MQIITLLLTLSIVNAIDASCNIPFCHKCNGDKCKQCINQYVLKDDKCVFGLNEIHPKCKMIKNNLCVECLNGYHLEKGKCVTDDYLCLEYKRGECKKCHDGYTLIENKCVKCNMVGCADCDGNIDKCNWCYHNYQTVNNTCIQTIEGCKLYMNPFYEKSPCLECRSAYWLENGTCVGNNFDHCMSVNKYKGCGTCFEPYSSDKEGMSCVVRKNEDLDYTNYNQYVRCELLRLDIPECMKCEEGFYRSNKTGPYQCHECTEKDKTTCEGKDADSCRKCNDDCTFINGTCHTTHCAIHTLEYDSVPSKCKRCKKGYYANDTEFCIESDGCAKKEGDKCIECHQNWYLTEEWTCVPCELNCLGCMNKSDHCTECYEEGLSHTVQTCQNCADKGCRYCDEDPNYCTQCYEGYDVDEFGKCHLVCFEDDGKECTACRDMYEDKYRFYRPVNGKCPRYSEIYSEQNGKVCVGEYCIE